MTVRKRLAGLAAVLAAVTASAIGGSVASAGIAAFTDPGGDASGAPDISSVSLSNVAATGDITVSVAASGLAASTSVDVWLDTDKNSATGSVTGNEYLLEVWQEAADWGWTIEKWSGTDWVPVPDSPAQRFSRSGDQFTWTLNKSDLGNVRSFAFRVGSYLFGADDKLQSSDSAPDGGTWAYDLSTPAQVVAVKAVVGKPFAVPAKPHAGTLLSLAFPVTRSDNGQALSGGTVSATTKIGGASVLHTQSLHGGSAAVNVLIPKNAKGKLLTVTVHVSVGGETTTKVVTFRIT